MAATTQRSTIALLTRLKRDFTDLAFVSGDAFAWSPATKTIYYGALDQSGIVELLHELAHATLGHDEYRSDVGLLEMERQAWEYAVQTLAPRYQVALSMDDDIVQDALDSYRDWLHVRSRCPDCTAVGLQSGSAEYRCLYCHTVWSVNQARSCRLKRYKK